MADELKIARLDAFRADPDLPLDFRILAGELLNDDDGFVARRVLPDGQCLAVIAQIFNTKLTLSRSIDDPGWEHAW